ncbi:lanthionine synthetase LanC family protein [Mucilaginibacter panaciglaebae]|uniref:Lanthionine synthetase-like protein n=1 Tax=Mucilaginibacter panaciglaebae TaxID=502331 RepID=A0ABP7X263_9SPHI
MRSIRQINNLLLNEIAEILISKTPGVTNVGLFYGKAGIALFFYKYSLYANDNRFKKFAELLIDDVCGQMSSISSLSFSEGLSGIGWCFAHLFQNNFLDNDTDEILLEIDEIIIKKQSQHCVMYENSGDVFGSGIYCLSRLYTPEINRNTTYLLSKTQNVLFLIDECENILYNHLSKNLYVPAIRLQTLISIVYFLLEAYKLGLNIEKVKKVLSCLPDYFKSSLKLYIDNIDRDLLLTQINEITLILNDEDCKIKCESVLEIISQVPDFKIAIGNLTNDCCKISLYNLIYRRQLTNSKQVGYLSDIYRIVNNNILIEDILSNVHDYNLGLNGGIAGLGLSLLDAINKQ